MRRIKPIQFFAVLVLVALTISGSAFAESQEDLTPSEKQRVISDFDQDYALTQLNYNNGKIKAIDGGFFALEIGVTDYVMKMTDSGWVVTNEMFEEALKLPNLDAGLKERIRRMLRVDRAVRKVGPVGWRILKGAGVVAFVFAADGAYEMITKSDKTPVSDFFDYITFLPSYTDANDTVSYQYLKNFKAYLSLSPERARFYAAFEPRLKAAVKVMADLLRAAATE